MIVALGTRPDTRQRHEVREVERMDEGLADVGISVTGQRREPGLDCVHALANGREPKAIDDTLDSADLLLDRGTVAIDHRDGRGQIAERNMIRSEEHTSELQSLMRISYAVFC